MASLYKKKRSPFWYMEWRDPKTGLTLNRSTKFRYDSPDQSRRAKQLCAQRTADELEAPPAGMSRCGENWRWVDGFLRMAYSTSPKTLQRYQQAWFAFSTFLAERKIAAPRHLQREEAESYVMWRMNPVKGCGVRAAVKNTALLDLKVISRIMREAVARKLAPANPFLQLGFKKDPVKSRPDILPEEMKIILRELPKVNDEAMHVSWAIAMCHGRRLSETSVPLTDVDLRGGTITFRNKGGAFRTKLLHSDLVPMMRKFKKEGRERTFEMPQNFSKRWAKFFDRIGLPHITFHSTRVRVATRLMEKGVDQRIAMDFIDHSSALVHRIYLKARPEHHRSAVDALGSSQ
jgi:site-specific recombinase XerD